MLTRRHIRTLFVLSIFFTLTACTPIRPVTKVGLIAPFEGLYRQTGYAALDAVRLAIADCAPANVDVIPLALDDSAQPEAAARSAQKLLADPAVTAVIGPYSLDTIVAVAPHMAGSAAAWVVPTAVDAYGAFATPGANLDWLSDLLLDVATIAAAEGARAMHVGGVPDAWESSVRAAVSSVSPPIPITIVPAGADFSEIGPDGVLLWLGQPHLGARAALRLHDTQPAATFWLGPQGDDPVFTAHNTAPDSHYWGTWVTPQYNRAVQPAPGTLTAHLTYAATCHALAEVNAATDSNSTPFRLAAFRVEGQEISELSAAP